MKKLILIISIWITGMATHSQIEAPVKWSYAAKRLSSTEAVVFLKATIEPGWHIYSLNVKDGGPIKTSFSLAPSKDYSLDGKPGEPKPISKYDSNFKMNLTYFEKEVIFEQKIKLKPSAAPVIKGKLEYMTCNDKKCLPPEDLDFSVSVSK